VPEQTATTGATTPRQFRLSEAVISQLDLIATTHGLSSRAEAIRYLTARESAAIERRKNISGKSAT
jgi:metal-responsive CopG/Arc/MetJ family transcriptional regulator